MDNGKKVAERVEGYRELAKENKNIDVLALTDIALMQSAGDEVSSRGKRWSYLVSVSLPPLGLVPAVYYYFSGKSDGKTVALTCAILTAIAAIVAWIVGSLFLSSLGTGGDGLKNSDLNVNLQDLKGLLQ